MRSIPESHFGWATRIVPSFDFAALALRLGHIESDTCNARKQGNCLGKYYCADCAWSEGPSREPR